MNQKHTHYLYALVIVLTVVSTWKIAGYIDLFNDTIDENKQHESTIAALGEELEKSNAEIVRLQLKVNALP